MSELSSWEYGKEFMEFVRAIQDFLVLSSEMSVTVCIFAECVCRKFFIALTYGVRCSFRSKGVSPMK
jgi:hypothetical protein